MGGSIFSRFVSPRTTGWKKRTGSKAAWRRKRNLYLQTFDRRPLPSINGIDVLQMTILQHIALFS